MYKEKIKKSFRYSANYVQGEGFVSEIISKKSNTIKIIIETNKKFNHLPEKILAYIDNKSNNTIKQGDIIKFKGDLKKIHRSTDVNAYDNYKYYYNKNILYFIKLRNKDYIICNENSIKNISYFFKILKNKISDATSRNKNISDENLAIIDALTIGIKNNIDWQIKQIFINSGAIHVLALSGLHVGIIYIIILFVFKFLPYKFNEKVKFIIVILILWFYCFLTGCGPSVFRASLMFSLFQLSQLMEKKTNGLNILLFSAVFLIIVKPANFYDHGYYLSHLSMASIIIFYPRFNILINVKKKFHCISGSYFVYH